MYIPKGKNERADYLNKIKNAANLEQEIKMLREDKKAIVDDAVEKYGVTPKEFNAVVKVQIDKNKIEAEIEERSTAVANYEILTGQREAPVQDDEQEQHAE